LITRSHTNSNRLFYEFRIVTDSPFGQDSNDSGVRFSDFDGNVEVQPAGEDYWNLAELGMILHYDDHIRTGVESMAILSFRDMTTYTMKTETEIVLSRPAEEETKLHMKQISNNCSEILIFNLHMMLLQRRLEKRTMPI
jgi:hypothetical protein